MDEDVLIQNGEIFTGSTPALPLHHQACLWYFCAFHRHSDHQNIKTGCVEFLPSSCVHWGVSAVVFSHEAEESFFFDTLVSLITREERKCFPHQPALGRRTRCHFFLSCGVTEAASDYSTLSITQRFNALFSEVKKTEAHCAMSVQFPCYSGKMPES